MKVSFVNYGTQTYFAHLRSMSIIILYLTSFLIQLYPPNVFSFSASNLSKSNSMNNKNSLNNKINNGNVADTRLTNGTNSNLINNNENKNATNNNTAKTRNNSSKSTNSKANTSMEEISPWLVQDNVIINKKAEKSKIPLLKTVITTEL